MAWNADLVAMMRKMGELAQEKQVWLVPLPARAHEYENRRLSEQVVHGQHPPDFGCGNFTSDFLRHPILVRPIFVLHRHVHPVRDSESSAALAEAC